MRITKAGVLRKHICFRKGVTEVMRRVPEVDEVVQRIQKKMKPWGITLSYLAQRLGVSRQYAWQIVHYRTILSRAKALEIEKAVDSVKSAAHAAAAKTSQMTHQAAAHIKSAVRPH